jgi:hypothetical protein
MAVEPSELMMVALPTDVDVPYAICRESTAPTPPPPSVNVTNAEVDVIDDIDGVLGASHTCGIVGNDQEPEKDDFCPLYPVRLPLAENVFVPLDAWDIV